MAADSAHFLPAIYDAALSDEHWPRALALLSSELAAVGAFLIAVDQVGLPFTIQQASDTYRPEDIRHYLENLSHYDEAVLTRTLALTPAMRLLRDCDVWPDLKALDERPDYRWMRETIGARRKAGVRISEGKGWMDLLAFQFDADWAPSPDPIQTRLDRLLPHVAKVIEINRKFSILRQQYRAVLAALDHVRIGTCVTTSIGHVVVSNSEARRIFSLDDGISLSRMGLLTCPTADLTTELGQKTRAAASTARGEGAEHEVVVFAPRRSGARPFLIEIAPLRDSLGELERNFAGAIVFIIDPENQAAVSTQRLSRLFALTEAEAEICRHMVGGRSAGEIARMRGVSEETVRSQFKAVYAKTGVSRRADLVRLAITVDPPIGRPGDPE